jgi:hypothetical protein
MYRGDTAYFQYTSSRVTDATANPVTTTPLILTGATIAFTAKENIDDTNAQATFTKTTSSGITITSALTGEFKVKISPSDTSGLNLSCSGDFKELYFDVQITLGATNGVYVSGDVITIDSGILTVFADRTL